MHGPDVSVTAAGKWPPLADTGVRVVVVRSSRNAVARMDDMRRVSTGLEEDEEAVWCDDMLDRAVWTREESER